MGELVAVVGGTVVAAPGPEGNCPLNGPVTDPGVVKLPAAVGRSETVTGWPGLPSVPGLPPPGVELAGGWVAVGPLGVPAGPDRTVGGGPSEGSQASAGVLQEPGAAHAVALNDRFWAKVLRPPVECNASTAMKHFTLRQFAPPSAVVSTAGNAIVVEATPALFTVTTALCRLSQASWTEAPGSRSSKSAFGSQSATA